ncbi:hypothetical protein DACRYDRAFT_22310 [Dacryopinax primogenitus]|uniref:Uncharacterized protein n=1 Tax=Dacryopinax primogenitus (strain DJM 731) TaxID=1858805 RepID=M5G7K9_DACPD|nr:uncharacterized protein DACRYDRAFT_22310 [Dacryopinax primogenitus]EJU01867.1 hypothetical protein DACRYDRAFT_22310 [Dacryopinax primogenitus]
MDAPGVGAARVGAGAGVGGGGGGAKRTPPRQRGKLAGLFPGLGANGNAATATGSAVAPGAPTAGRGVSPAPTAQAQAQVQAKDIHSQQGPVARLLKRPRGIERRGRIWGTGRELDGIEDLPVGKEDAPTNSSGAGVSAGAAGANGAPGPSSWGTVRRGMREPSPGPTAPAPGPGAKVRSGLYALRQGQKASQPKPPQPQAQPPAPASSQSQSQPFAALGNGSVRSITSVGSVGKEPTPRSRAAPRVGEKENVRERKGRKGPTLIRDLGSLGLPRTQNGMKWNPTKQRWDGQEHLLNVFDPPPSARPALITHLTSSITSPLFKTLGLTGAGAVGARVVGEMMFDPVEMRWLRRDGAEEEDVFKHVEEESSVGSEHPDSHEHEHETDAPGAGGTIRARLGSNIPSPGKGTGAPVDPDLINQCREAEARHRLELAGWLGGMESVPASPVEDDDHAGKGHRWLWDIRTLAMQT